MRKTITLLISAALLLVVNARGQTVAGTFIDAVASGGNNVSGLNLLGSTNANVNWTVGQAVIDFDGYTEDNQTQGFNQPFKCVFIADTNWYQGPDSCFVLVPNENTIDPEDSVWVFDQLCWHYEVGAFPHYYSDGWCVTSINENNAEANGEVEVYPNPATEQITIVISQNLNANGTLQVFDINGKLSQQTAITSNQQSADVSALTPGIYLLRIVTNNNQLLSTHKLIKQ